MRRSSGKVLLSVSSCEQGGHGQPIHALAFTPNGSLLLSGGDDKLLKLWSTDSWQCIKTLSAPKKISAAAFSADAKHVMFADKFGDVLCGTTSATGASSAVVPGNLLLGHFCAVVTSLQSTPDSKFLISTDRESKVRVSVLPENPLQVSATSAAAASPAVYLYHRTLQQHVGLNCSG